MSKELAVAMLGVIAAVVGLVAALVGRRKEHIVRIASHSTENEHVTKAVTNSVIQAETSSRLPLARDDKPVVLFRGLAEIYNFGYGSEVSTCKLTVLALPSGRLICDTPSAPHNSFELSSDQLAYTEVRDRGQVRSYFGDLDPQTRIEIKTEKRTYTMLIRSKVVADFWAALEQVKTLVA